MTDIQKILNCLNQHEIRASYGAVGEVLGIPAIGVGRRLGLKRQEASWIVSASSGLPSGYASSDYHPALFEREVVIRKGDELRKLLGEMINEELPKQKSSTISTVRSSAPRQLATHSRYQIAGIDLAWMSERNGSGIAIGSLSGRQLLLESLRSQVLGIDNIQRMLMDCEDLGGVAVDAPLIIKNTTGSRGCEEALNVVYTVKWAGCYPSNLILYPEASSVAMSFWLQTRGFAHLGLSQGKKWQIECYPHPAIIELFGLPRRLKYKKGSLTERQSGQMELARLLRSLESSPTLQLVIPDQYAHILDEMYIESLSGLRLKGNEDALDAIVCLYVAGLYATGESMHVFRDTDTGYIVVPRPTQ